MVTRHRAGTHTWPVAPGFPLNVSPVAGRGEGPLEGRARHQPGMQGSDSPHCLPVMEGDVAALRVGFLRIPRWYRVLGGDPW